MQFSSMDRVIQEEGFVRIEHHHRSQILGAIVKLKIRKKIHSEDVEGKSWNSFTILIHSFPFF